MGHSVLPKSVTEERIKQNIDVYDWSIPEDLLVKFSEIKQVSSTSFDHLYLIVNVFKHLYRLFLNNQCLHMIWTNLH